MNTTGWRMVEFGALFATSDANGFALLVVEFLLDVQKEAARPVVVNVYKTMIDKAGPRPRKHDPSELRMLRSKYNTLCVDSEDDLYARYVGIPDVVLESLLLSPEASAGLHHVVALMIREISVLDLVHRNQGGPQAHVRQAFLMPAIYVAATVPVGGPIGPSPEYFMRWVAGMMRGDAQARSGRPARGAVETFCKDYFIFLTRQRRGLQLHAPLSEFWTGGGESSAFNEKTRSEQKKKGCIKARALETTTHHDARIDNSHSEDYDIPQPQWHSC